MFRTKCPNCGERIGKHFNFCPFCGGSVKEKSITERDKRGGGLLDEMDESMGFNGIKLPFGFNALFNRLTKEIDKQLRDFDKVIGETKQPIQARERKRKIIPLTGSGISISISSTGEKGPIIRMKPFGVSKEGAKQVNKFTKETPKIKPVKLTPSQEIKLASLPRKEPETRVRRLTDRIIYEIDLPGVKDKKDIIINQLENSIEIKALSKERVFFKLIPVSFPVKKYDFRGGRLILELKPQD